ncbi:MAG TPA: MaoC family dehydratase [Paracoccaceae bacterium]|nr:MaoC family dehydratase [Paracoccaceae bacterium]
MNEFYRTAVPLDELAARKGEETVSRWFPITQDRVDAFAEATEDRYFIHTDPGRARAEAPWGGTIAHGFLTASLLSAMAYDAVPTVREAKHGVNYGFDRLRFVSPVPVGSQVRGRFRLGRCDRSRPGEVTLHWSVTVEIEGAERPALAAEWITRQFL